MATLTLIASRTFEFDPVRLKLAFPAEYADTEARGSLTKDQAFLLETVGELTSWGERDHDHLDLKLVECIDENHDWEGLSDL